MAQLRASLPQVMRPSMAAVTMSALPVKSSVPSRMTIMRPMGKIRPETKRTIPASERACAAVEEVTAPRPIRRPAARPRTNSLHAGEDALPTLAFM